MSAGSKLEIAVLKAYWEETFDHRMEAAETLQSKIAAGAERVEAQRAWVRFGIELAKTEHAIRKLEKTP